MDRRFVSIIALGALALGSAGAEYADTPCQLSDLVGHNWSYIAPPAFAGGAWDSDHACVFTFTAAPGASSGAFEFTTPPGCVHTGHSGAVRGLLGAPGAAPGGGGQQAVSLRFPGLPGCGGLPGSRCTTPAGEAAMCPVARGACDTCGCSGATNHCQQCLDCVPCANTDAGAAHVHVPPPAPTRKAGWMSARCGLIDMEDGGMYVRGHPGRPHPMDFAPHEYLALVAAWVTRSAIVTFAQDGSQHLTPGIPVAPNAKPHYYGCKEGGLFCRIFCTGLPWCPLAAPTIPHYPRRRPPLNP